MTPEKKIEETIKHHLNQLAAYWVKTWGGTYSKKGVPDILCCIQHHFVALELKRPTGGKPTPVQIKNLYQIAKNGGIALITNDPNVDQTIQQLIHQQPIRNNLYQIALTESDLPQIRPENAAKLWQQYQKNHEPYTVQIIAK